jgi:hypothetical protein
MIIRGIISSVTSGANRVAKFIGRFTKYGSRPFMQHWGFFSRPLDGAEGVLVRFGDNMIVIASDDSRYTITLSQGEVAVGTGDNAKVHVKSDGSILIKSSQKVQVQAPAIEVGAGLLEKMVMGEQFQIAYLAHFHTSATPGSPTSGPMKLMLPDPPGAVTSIPLSGTAKVGP